MNKNNFRVFHDLSSNRLIFLPHGLDQMFGVFRSTPETTITPHMKGLVARSLVEIPEGRRRYLDRMGQLLTNVFKAELLTAQVHQLAAQLRPALADNPDELRSLTAAAEALASRMSRRAASVAQQLRQADDPLAFDAAGEAKLAGWRPQRDAGSPSFSNNSRGNGPRLLEIRAPGSRSYGSWRTTVLLDEGEYQFVGKVQLEGLEIGAGVTNGGVTLRMSGERSAKMIREAAEWTTLTYNFTIRALADIELLCEFRGSKGRVRFDANSLKLIRKTKAAQEKGHSNH